MPFRSRRKKTFRRRQSRRKFGVKRKTKRTKFSSRPNMIVYNRSRFPLPPRYRCKFETDFMFQLASMAGFAGTNIVGWYLNSVFQPLNIGSVGSMSAVGTATSWTLLNYTTAAQPQGLSNLLNTTTGGSGPYNYYRVYASKCTVTPLLATISDNIQYCLLPVAGNNAPTNYFTAIQDMFSVQGFAGAAMRNRSVKKYIHCADLFGISKTAYIHDLSGNYDATGNTHPVIAGYWALAYTTADQAATATIMTFRIRTEYWTELFWLPSRSLIST